VAVANSQQKNNIKNAVVVDISQLLYFLQLLE
jgi:hypothetical protein